MKNLLLIINILLFGTISYAQTGITIKGIVKDWPTDTIYAQTMPFYSPHSSKLKFQTIKRDSVFSFTFNNSGKPLVIQLFSNRKQVKTNRERLLFLNFTDEYYYGHCNKFYTYGIATFLIEPNKTLDVVLKYNQYEKKLTNKVVEKYKKLGIKVSEDNKINITSRMNIKFNDSNSFQDKYYQKSFGLDDKVDKRLEIYSYKSRSIEAAIVSFKKIKQSLLDKLELEKEKLSTVFYDYIKAEIEFGARKEFLKFIMLDKEKDAFFSKEIPKEVKDIIEFDKTKVNQTTLISEEYNKFLMLYLNFKLNILNKEYNKHYNFGLQKIRTAIRSFPKESVYYFIANHLLLPQINRDYLIKTIKNEEAVDELITKTITKYPDGELNDKLIEQYDL